MARITLRTPSQTKNFIRRKNKLYKKLDTCVHRGSTRYYDGFKDIDVRVYHYTKHRVKKIGDCVWLCKAVNNTDPNCQSGWDFYEPIEKLAYMSYPPKRISIRKKYSDAGEWYMHIRD